MAIDQAFNADTLGVLRKLVLAEVTAAGVPAARAAEIMIAVHELAANAVRHGAGAGLARLGVEAGEVRCQVIDAGPGSTDGHRPDGAAGGAQPWPVEPGHGLWLVHQVADLVSVTCNPAGCRVTAVFAVRDLDSGSSQLRS